MDRSFINAIQKQFIICFEEMGRNDIHRDSMIRTRVDAMLVGMVRALDDVIEIFALNGPADRMTSTPDETNAMMLELIMLVMQQTVRQVRDYTELQELRSPLQRQADDWHWYWLKTATIFLIDQYAHMRELDGRISALQNYLQMNNIDPEK